MHASPPPKIELASRPTPLPEPPRPLLERLRDWLDEAVFQIRRFVADTCADFRQRDRFFKWKAGILAAWALCSVVSVRVALAGPPALADNGLQAYVAVTHTTMSWGLLVHNRSGEPWTKVRVVLEGGWAYERPSVGADERIVLSPEQFVRDGRPAPADLAIGTVRLETAAGTATPAVVH